MNISHVRPFYRGISFQHRAEAESRELRLFDSGRFFADGSQIHGRVNRGRRGPTIRGLYWSARGPVAVHVYIDRDTGVYRTRACMREGVESPVGRAGNGRSEVGAPPTLARRKDDVVAAAATAAAVMPAELYIYIYTFFF